MTSHGAITRDAVLDPGTCYSQVPRVPTWNDLGRLLQGLGRRQLMPLFPLLVDVAINRLEQPLSIV
jgi:hypothetical protein